MNSHKIFAIKKLQKELEDINNQVENFTAGMVDDDPFNWELMIEGPQDSLYEGGLFQVEIKFPHTYPNDPPDMIFKTQMWHPNIYTDGKVCISILHAAEEDQFNTQESILEKWRPVLGVQEIVISVISMLTSPNIDSPANIDASVQFKNDNEGWKKKVRLLTRKSVEDM